MAERAHNREKLQLPQVTDVVIVGAGLSGLYAAIALNRRGIDTVVIDSRSSNSHKEAAYLVNNRTASTWGIPDAVRANRPRISGVKTYNREGFLKEKISPVEHDGFTPVPQRVMENHLLQQYEGEVHYGTQFQRVEEDGNLVNVTTSRGAVAADLVIDATGWRGNVIHSFYGPEDFEVMSLYGGNYRVTNIDPRYLHFIRGNKEDKNNKNWIFPLNKSMAEVVAAQQLQIGDMTYWYEQYADNALRKMRGAHAAHNRQIDTRGKKTHRLAFRVEPASRDMYQGRVIPFGEAAGLNSPSVGQLIDVLPHYAGLLAELAVEAKQTGEWEKVGSYFHRAFMEEPPFLYLVHTLMRENNNKADSQLRSPNTPLMNAIHTVFDNEQLWNILQNNGLNKSDLFKLIRQQPDALVKWFIASIPTIASSLIRYPDLYAQTILTMKKKIL